jgi:hypothetical protein
MVVGRVFHRRRSKVKAVHLLLDIRMAPRLGREARPVQAFEQVIVAKWTGIDQDGS